ncbi:MAG: rod shape-determining protein MreC [Oscillospiraceae bacterium]|nr:rod shape-determining protein MreC [Oscillospiraceae bacterium]
MREFFKTKKFKFILFIIAVVIGIMINSLTNDGYTSEGASLFASVTEPFQRVSTNISRSVSSSLDMLINAEKYYNQNQQLRETLNDFYRDMIDYDKLKRENEELRVLLGLKEEYEDYVFSPPCRIIARTANDPYGSFTIDRGSNDGITPHSPVITSQGLIGVCYDVSASTSKVRTLFSPRTAVGVTVLRSKTIGVMEGNYELAADGLCRVNFLSKTADIIPGDIMITTGSETFPPGHLVGTVEEVGTVDSGLSRYAVIRPAIDPYTITDVFVILSFSGREDD